MEEDKREAIRKAAHHTWLNLSSTSFQRDVDIFQARQRAKLSVLDLTERDKRFLKEMKIAV